MGFMGLGFRGVRVWVLALGMWFKDSCSERIWGSGIRG